jgi:hypothetical protein
LHCWNHRPLIFSTAWLILWHKFLQPSLSSSNHSFDVTSPSLPSFINLPSFGGVWSFIQILHLWNLNPTGIHEEQLSVTVQFSCDPHATHVSYQEAHCQPCTADVHYYKSYCHPHIRCSTTNPVVTHEKNMSITTNPTVIHVQNMSITINPIVIHVLHMSSMTVLTVITIQHMSTVSVFLNPLRTSSLPLQLQLNCRRVTELILL